MFLDLDVTQTSKTELGKLDEQHVSEVKAGRKRKPYFVWKDKDRYLIGKYACDYGNASAIRKFKSQFPHLNESTVRNFKSKVQNEIHKASIEKRKPMESISKYSSPTGRPLMLGELDSMIQSYIKSLSNRGGVVNTVIANATAKALMKRYPNIVGEIDVDNSRWAKCLFQRMNFVKRRKTLSKVDIPEGARKEIEYIFLHEIVSLVEEFHIPNSLILNLDQTPLKYVPVGDETMAKKGSKT